MAENVHGSALCWGAYVALVFLAVPACGQIALFIDEQGIRYDGLRLARAHGRFDLRMAPAPVQRLIMLTESYRDGWRATASDGQGVEVVRPWGGVLGIVAPAGTTKIELRYAPRPEVLATIVSHLALVIAAILLVMLLSRSRGGAGLDNRQGDMSATYPSLQPGNDP